MTEFVAFLTEILAIDTDLFDPMIVLGLGLVGVVFLRLIKQFFILINRPINTERMTALAWIVQFVFAVAIVSVSLYVTRNDYMVEDVLRVDQIAIAWLVQVGITFIGSLIVQQLAYVALTRWLEAPLFKPSTDGGGS